MLSGKAIPPFGFLKVFLNACSALVHQPKARLRIIVTLFNRLGIPFNGQFLVWFNAKPVRQDAKFQLIFGKKCCAAYGLLYG